MKMSFGKVVGLVLCVLGILLVFLSFISAKGVLSYYTWESSGSVNGHYPAGLYLMESWYTSNETILIFEWEFSEDVHVYAGKYEDFTTGMLLNDYLGHAFAEDGSMTVYPNEKGDHVFAAYSPEDFSLYHTSFKAIYPVAGVEKDNNLTYLGVIVSLIGILVLVFPKRIEHSD